MSDVVVIFFSSIVVLTQNGNFWVVPLLHSVSDMTTPFTRAIYGDLLKLNVENTGLHNFKTNFALSHQEIRIIIKSGRLCLYPTQFTKYINFMQMTVNALQNSSSLKQTHEAVPNIGIVIMAGRSWTGQKNRLLSTTTTLDLEAHPPSCSVGNVALSRG
jgi:hypothetical protein